MNMTYHLLPLQLDPNRGDREGVGRIDGGVEEKAVDERGYVGVRKRGRAEKGIYGDPSFLL